MTYMRLFSVRKCLVLKRNLSTLNSHGKQINQGQKNKTMRLTKRLANWLTQKTSAEDAMIRYADNGKPELLDYLVHLTGKDLYHFLLSQTNPDWACDLSQMTWLKVMEKRALYRASGRFKSWLFTLGRNQMIDDIRKSQRWDMIEWDDDMLTNSDAGPSVDLSDALSAEDELSQFNAVLERLPFLQKEAFILQQEGFSVAEIATITAENNETIKSRLRYARNCFKQHFGSEDLAKDDNNKQEDKS
ncbi:MAG: RNA polymerase sigma factor (sigma-70 family) [Phenylobacterium sp.]|jgi:RNA polymerase sigma factor (sigma-70 family)